MQTVTQNEAGGEHAAPVRAALVIVGIRELSRLGHSTPAIVKVVEQLDVARSYAYELAGRIDGALPDMLSAPEPVEPPAELVARQQLASAVLEFLIAHPGAMIAGSERNRYSDGFRRFIVGLLAPAEPGFELSLPVVAEVTHIPLETLRDWMSGSRRRPNEPTDRCSDTDPDTSEPPVYAEGVAGQILALWRQTSGISVAVFARILREQHRIDVPVKVLVNILELAGDWSTSRPRKPKPDPEAIRGALERFFPGAQWVGDGTSLAITINGQRYLFIFELMVDAFSGAHVGFDVTDTEDADAVVGAFESGKYTTGGTCEAVLLDNRPSNRSSDVCEALQADDVLIMSSTLFRPQNKASVEGAFGLFSQTMPPMFIDATSPRSLARQILVHVLTAYCCGRNHVPRRGLKTTSAADVYADANPSDAEREQARQRLREINQRIERQHQHEHQRTDPVCRRLVKQTFDTHGLTDPEGRFVPVIAKYGLDAVTEAVAVFDEHLRTGKQLEFPQRYLLGIARNIARRNFDLAVYERLVALRHSVNDELLEPLREQDRELRSDVSPRHYVDATLDRALAADIELDRAWWRQRYFEALQALSTLRRRAALERAPRIIAVSYRTPQRERNAMLARIAALKAEPAAA